MSRLREQRIGAPTQGPARLSRAGVLKAFEPLGQGDAWLSQEKDLVGGCSLEGAARPTIELQK